MDALTFLMKAITFKPGHTEEALIQFKGPEKPVKTQIRKLPGGQAVFTVSYSATTKENKQQYASCVDRFHFQDPATLQPVLKHIIESIEGVLTHGLGYGYGEESPLYHGVVFY